MEIVEAFSPDVVATAGVGVGGDDESQLHDVLRAMAEQNRLEWTVLDIRAITSVFEAGRAYQADLEPRIPIWMSVATVSSFMEWLQERGQ